MEKEIKLRLKVKHFEDTVYSNTGNCAVAKAAKEHFDITNPLYFVSEGVDNLTVGDKKYKHKNYGYRNFRFDKFKCIFFKNNPERVIRTIKLK
jgi:hypothetical protein